MTELEKHRHSQPQASEALDPASQALADALRLVFIVLKIVVVCVVALFIYNGTFKVEQNEQAVVLTFGKVTGGIKDPGWHWALPYPVQEYIKIPAPAAEKQLDVAAFWYYETDREKMGLKKPVVGATLQFVRDGYSLTASKSVATISLAGLTQGYKSTYDYNREESLLPVTDYNIVHSRWKIRYSITDPINFVEQLWDGTEKGWFRVERLLENILCNAVILVSAKRDIEDILWFQSDQFKENVLHVMTKQLEALDVGLNVALELLDRKPPRQVRFAFDQAAGAQSQADKLVTAAWAKANGIKSAALAEAKIMIAQAEAYHTKVVQAAKADAKYLDEVLTKIDQAVRERIPSDAANVDKQRQKLHNQLLAVVVEELYHEVLRKVMARAEEVFVLNTPDNGTIELRPVLSRDANIGKTGSSGKDK